MKFRFQPTAPNTLYSFGAVVLSGSLISALLTSDKRWMDWHFSRLGEGGYMSSGIFNITMFVGGVMIFILGRELARVISRANLPTHGKSSAQAFVYKLFSLVALCFVGVSVFPFDRYPAIHNTFGYGMTLTMMALCLLTPKFVPFFSEKFYHYGYLILLVSAVLFGLFFAYQPFTLLDVEVVVFTMIYIWLVLFTNGICRKQHEASC